MAENNSIQLRIKSISTIEFATVDSCYDENDKVDIDTGFGFAMNKSDKSLAIKFEVAFRCKKSSFIILKLACEFNISPDAMDSFHDRKTKKTTVPKGLFTHLCVVTVGTARGVLYSKLENTPYSQYLLPTMNISEFIKEDIVFD